jgi:hypothetical protein
MSTSPPDDPAEGGEYQCDRDDSCDDHTEGDGQAEHDDGDDGVEHEIGLAHGVAFPQ